MGRAADNHGSGELVPRPITSRGNTSPCFIIISKLFLPIGERFVSLVLRTPRAHTLRLVLGALRSDLQGALRGVDSTDYPVAGLAIEPID